MHNRALRIISGLGGVVAVVALMPGTAIAQEASEVQAVLDNIWVFIAGCLVFFMQAGFALVEAGLTRAKNVVNIFAKNMADAIIGILAFFASGYALAFSSGNDFFGTNGGSFFMNDLDINALGGSGVINLSHGTFFFFQAVFAATAVTICSGAMAERTKFSSYLIFSVFMCGIIYPVVVHMTWGGGFIAGLVAITGPCGTATPIMSIVIGAIGGIIVVVAVQFFDKIKIDDPVGAISVHGVVGMWGVLSIGIFARYDDAFLGREDAGLLYGGGLEQLGVQALMVIIIIAWVGIASLIVFSALKATIGLRVSEEEEAEGLDVPEHGMAGYTNDPSYA